VVQITTILGQNGHIGLYNCQLHFSKYFYLGCIQYTARDLCMPGSVYCGVAGVWFAIG